MRKARGLNRIRTRNGKNKKKKRGKTGQQTAFYSRKILIGQNSTLHRDKF